LSAEVLDIANFSENNILSDFEVIIGADIVYDDLLTEQITCLLEAFFKRSSHRKVALFSLEKRYIFTLKDLDTVAPAFDLFIDKYDFSALLLLD